MLSGDGRIAKQGAGSGTKYYPVNESATATDIRLSSASQALITYIKKPISDRTASAFNAELINLYKHNETNWFSDVEKARLGDISGGASQSNQPAGTYARRIMDRLLIDLSWNSSRLEGNTCSLLDTRRLISFIMKSLILVPITWAYTRSAQHYADVQQQLGTPDPFRLKHRNSLLSIVREIVTTSLPRNQITQTIQSWTSQNIDAADQERFRAVAEVELHSLHEGNFARYRIRPSEFERWRKV